MKKFSLGLVLILSATANATTSAQQAPAPNLPVIGDWKGPLNAADGSSAGTIEIELQNQMIPVTAADGTVSQATVLAGMVQLSNIPNSQAAITSAAFNPADNSITASIAAQDANQNNETLILSGKISDSTFTGQIQAAGNSTVTTFVASMGASTGTQTVTSKRMQFLNPTYFSTRGLFNFR
jgi:hypothetical protein